MREAKASDHRRHAYARPYPLKLREFQYENVPVLGQGVLHFQGGPSLICGANGVGKSSILQAIYGTLTGSSRLSERAMRRLEGGRFVALLETPDGPVTKKAGIVAGKVVGDGTPQPCPVAFLDMGHEATQWLSLFETTTKMDELLAALAPAVSVAGELEEVRYLVGKEYVERLVYEIEEFGDPIPYFAVKTRIAQYQSEDMGLGEMSLHALYWQFSKAPPNSIVLIEEPETFVSPRSQKAFVDLLCKYCETRGLCVILTSHSLGIVGRLPLESVSLLYHGAAGSGVVAPPRQHQVNEVLGVPLRPVAMLLVEDAAARLFTSLLIDKIDHDLRFIVQIQSVVGTAAIDAALEGFPDTDLITLIGAYDGGHEVNDKDHSWEHVVLPGDDGPERVLRSALAGRTDFLATALTQSQGEVAAALSAFEGHDDHDWIGALAQRLGVSIDRLFDVLIDNWLAVGANHEAGAQFCEGVRSIITEEEETEED